jgi:hypothetical protein
MLKTSNALGTSKKLPPSRFFMALARDKFSHRVSQCESGDQGSGQDDS